MAETNKKLYMEMQMDELKASLEENNEDLNTDNNNNKVEVSSKKKNKSNDEKNIELAKMYEDIAEYEEELEGFEKELEIINVNAFNAISAALTSELPDDERNYENELKGILIATWTHKIEMKELASQEMLEVIKSSSLNNLIETLNSTYPEHDGDFEKELKSIFINRLNMLIEIKKEHIKEEVDDIYIAGLKPSFVKRIYKQVHGIK